MSFLANRLSRNFFSRSNVLPMRSLSAFYTRRHAFSTETTSTKIAGPPMVYISGEEMTHYTMNLIMDQWITPFIDTSAWEFYDLSCVNRDNTQDQVLRDAVNAGFRLKAIFKEPTITPTEVQKIKLGLKKSWGSPNGAMRSGWNGITISRDTIHIDGIELGFKKPVLFERHAVGGEYGAGWSPVGQGRLVTTFFPDDEKQTPSIVDARVLKNGENVAVVYHNPLDNVEDLAHIFFQRCLATNVTPYVVTKKTVFKWQESFWQILKDVFDKDYATQFREAGLMKVCGNELQHLISDAATMQIIRWTDGGFGMACHNYDGDMLTDQVAQVHRSPGFITSNLVGKAPDGTLIKEFEASHGTVTDLYEAHLRGDETSLNPLGLAEALLGAMSHAAMLSPDPHIRAQMKRFTETLRLSLHNTFRYGQGTRDMAGPSGLTTEAFVSKVAWRLTRYLRGDGKQAEKLRPLENRGTTHNVDLVKMREMFSLYDKNGDGSIDFEEFTNMVVKLGAAPNVKNVPKTEGS